MAEGGEACSVFHGEAQQVEVGEVFGCGERGKCEAIREGKIVRPELVTGGGHQTIEDQAGRLRVSRSSGIPVIAKDAEKSVFHEGTGGPTISRERGLKKCLADEACG